MSFRNSPQNFLMNHHTTFLILVNKKKFLEFSEPAFKVF